MKLGDVFFKLGNGAKCKNSWGRASNGNFLFAGPEALLCDRLVSFFRYISTIRETDCANLIPQLVLYVDFAQ